MLSLLLFMMFRILKINRLPINAGITKLISQTEMDVKLIPKWLVLKIPTNFILSSFLRPRSVNNAMVGITAITKNITPIPSKVCQIFI